MKFLKRHNKLCVECGKCPALFRYSGKVKRDTRHTLCFGCSTRSTTAGAPSAWPEENTSLGDLQSKLEHLADLITPGQTLGIVASRSAHSVDSVWSVYCLGEVQTLGRRDVS
jgi:MinD superfamily P-loop ATPase